MSDAFEGSKNIAVGEFDLSNSVIIRSTKCKTACSVECNLQNPYWLLFNSLLEMKYLYNC